MPTDTTQAIAAATSQTAKYVAAVAAIAGAFLAGVMLATSAGDYGVGLSNTGWDLARGGMILCSTIAVLAGMTWWGVEQVTSRLAVRLDRNGNATLALTHRLDQLDAALADVNGMRSELYRMRGRLDATLMEQNELLHRLEQRLAVDVGVAYDLGAKSNGS